MHAAFHENLRRVFQDTRGPAYVNGGDTHSYEELWDTVRRFNRAFGGRSGLKIATRTRKSFPTYAAIHATVLSGNTWIPLSTTTPDDRLIAMLDLAEPDVVVVDGEASAALAEHGRARGYTIIDVAEPMQLDRGRDFAPVTVGPDDLAMIYFTSGSTGVPKGVRLTQDSLAVNVENILNLVKIRQGEVFADYHDLSFVISVPILFPCAITGGAVAPADNPRDQLMPVEHMIHNRVSTLITVPSTIARICKTLRGQSLPDLSVLISCGEPLHLDVLKSALEDLRPRHMYNFYGSTEVGPWTFHHPCSIEDVSRFADLGYLPIGTPIEGNEVRIGENDELLVAGRQVSPGYLGGVGEDRFVIENGERWYHTGDKVVIHDGLYVCKGRLDSQVKIAGHRVELLDVEAHLRAMEDVDNAICFTVGEDEARYVAAVLITETDIDLRTVRNRLEKKLPPYMLPKRIQCLASPPTNRSGKVDRVALREGFPT